MDILKLFGSNVKMYRIMKKLSQEKLAELTGLHRTYIGATERGERNISLKNMEKIALALNVRVEDLLKEREN
ncbi:TPA: helix-turn-helix transcriptional regulator [Bacillus cereus]|uniref:helix-turn-helix domain-containing protein n=1 Tax=Bacillus thuringiensis TaxID=1428 RepID=UPI000BFB7753|nr:helix-turn-helix transcriptional regulator [Bacillus thuringiensis]PGP44876.1 transcriptional regulator [Bacillus thuringiensis]PGR48646.1 transcriptional regulator [Bacillus thuringiensis]HDR4461390.1 helix-turn-helix transcriptional regulator [Bacillus cereus]HDR7760934.1 helix-turn-helix transcriptional regulator [Bacillus cereus]